MEDQSVIPLENRFLNLCLPSLFPGTFSNLLKFVKSILPWKLEKENPDLYSDFLELDNDHKNLCKHYDRSKITKLDNIKIDNLKKHMETTKEIWKWYMKNANNGTLTPEMEKDFLDNFLEV